MAAPARDKYYLRTLHEEISLYDRKIAHLLKYDTSFPNDKERDAAVTKLATKRDTLVKTARQMAEEGIEFRPSELPKSLRPEDAEVEASEPMAASEAPTPAIARVAERAVASTHNNAVLDFRSEVREYMQKRRKVYAAEA